MQSAPFSSRFIYYNAEPEGKPSAFIEKYVNRVIIVYTDVENGRFKRTSKEGL